MVQKHFIQRMLLCYPLPVNSNTCYYVQALKYQSVTVIVRPIREIVRRREEITGLKLTEVYCLSDPSVLVSH